MAGSSAPREPNSAQASNPSIPEDPTTTTTDAIADSIHNLSVADSSPAKGDNMSPKIKTEEDVSPDDQQDWSSGDDTVLGEPLDQHRQDVIDKIMKSFVNTLDSKISTLTSSLGAVKVKQEPVEEGINPAAPKKKKHSRKSGAAESYGAKPKPRVESKGSIDKVDQRKSEATEERKSAQLASLSSYKSDGKRSGPSDFSASSLRQISGVPHLAFATPLAFPPGQERAAISDFDFDSFLEDSEQPLSTEGFSVDPKDGDKTIKLEGDAVVQVEDKPKESEKEAEDDAAAAAATEHGSSRSAALFDANHSSIWSSHIAPTLSALAALAASATAAPAARTPPQPPPPRAAMSLKDLSTRKGGAGAPPKRATPQDLDSSIFAPSPAAALGAASSSFTPPVPTPAPARPASALPPPPPPPARKAAPESGKETKTQTGAADLYDFPDESPTEPASAPTPKPSEGITEERKGRVSTTPGLPVLAWKTRSRTGEARGPSPEQTTPERFGSGPMFSPSVDPSESPVQDVQTQQTKEQDRSEESYAAPAGTMHAEGLPFLLDTSLEDMEPLLSRPMFPSPPPLPMVSSTLRPGVPSTQPQTFSGGAPRPFAMHYSTAQGPTGTERSQDRSPPDQDHQQGGGMGAFASVQDAFGSVQNAFNNLNDLTMVPHFTPEAVQHILPDLQAMMNSSASALPDGWQFGNFPVLHGQQGSTPTRAPPAPISNADWGSMWNTKTEPPAASRKREASPELVEEKPGPSARRGTLGKEVEIEAEDHDGRRKKARKLASKVAMPGGKFACPYYKRNPRKYRNWTSCPGPGWEEVHRVKTHLYRRHTLPTQCPRCWDTFKTDTLLQAHIQQDPPCVVKENKLPHEGFTKDQEKRLRSRKKTQADMTDEDKWREIYLILFPDDHPDSVPTPYYDAPEDEETDTPASGTGSGSELEDYASFVRREMPTLVRRELEALFQNELADVEERLKPKVEQIVLGLQPRLMSLYKQSQMPLSDYGPEQQSQQPLTPASPGQLQGYSDKSCAYSPSVQQQQMRRSSGLGSAHSTPAMSTASGGSRSGTIIGSESTPEQELEKAFELDGFPTPPPTGYMNTPHLGVGQWDTMGMHMGMGVQGGQLPVQPAGPQGLGLNWDVEFDRMLDPMAFMPQPGQLGGGYQYQ